MQHSASHGISHANSVFKDQFLRLSRLIQRLSAEQVEVYHLPNRVSRESGLFHLLFFVVGACTIENAKIELKRLSISTHDLNELIPIATRQNIRSPCLAGMA